MEVKTLGELCNIVSGGTPSRSKAEFWNDGTIPWIKIGNIRGKYVSEADEYITRAGLDCSSAKLLTKGTILYTIFATLGEVGVLNIDACTNQAIAGLTIKDEKQLNTDYLYYYLKSKKSYVNNVGRGVAQNNINMSILRSFELPLPELSQQKQIVDVLDKVAAIIEARQQELQKLDDLIKARFVEMFGESGKQVPLTDYVWFQEGPGVRSVDFTPEGTILLTGSNINDNEISFGYKSDRFIADELANGKYAHFMCDVDDILAVTSAIAPEKFDQKIVTVKEDKKYCLNTGIIRFKPNKQFMTVGYFREFLKTDYFKHQVMSEMRGIAQMHFGPSHLKQMTILLPDSIDKQIEFEDFCKQLDKSKFLIVQFFSFHQKL